MVEIATLDKFISAADVQNVTFRQRLLAAASWEHLSNPIGILLYMCLQNPIYVSSYCCICVLILLYVSSCCYICVLILLYIICVAFGNGSSQQAATCEHLEPLRNTPQQPLGFHIRVRMLLHTCPHARHHLSNPLDIEVMHIRVRMLLYICPHAPVYVSACSCISVRMLLYTCPNAPVYVFAFYYICVRMPLYL